MENGRHIAFSLAVDTLYQTFLLEMLDTAFGTFKCAAEVTGAFRFVFTNVEDWS